MDTICGKFLDTVRKRGDATALLYKRGGNWSEISWNGYGDLVKSLAAGLQVVGVRKGDRVAICSNTRYEWAALDLAILGLGAVTVPIYQSSTTSDISFMVQDSGARILIFESAATAFKAMRKNSGADLRALETVVVIEPGLKESLAQMGWLGSSGTSVNGHGNGGYGNSSLANGSGHNGAANSVPSGIVGAVASGDLMIPTDRMMTFDELRQKGQVALKRSPTLYELATRELNTEDPATIVYTSGTTGQPRGVLLTHTQILSEVGDAFPLMGATARDRTLTFLPFAHVLGRLEIWGQALIGYTMAFAQSIERLRDDLIEVRPTIIIGVPRIFEKIYSAVVAQAEISPVRQRVFKWALEVGRGVSQHTMAKKSIPFDLALKYQLARRLVFAPLTERLGGNLRFAVCGGAPLSSTIAEFFHAAGLLLLEGYGLTETTACITVNTPFAYRFGTVGKTIGDVRLKVADDGEILVNSKKVMKSYYNNPDATSQVIIDGWFHTGDIGTISADGFLKITDRKKELIKTAGGKYVAPQRLENLLKNSPLISQVLIIGDQRKFIVALLTLNRHEIETFAKQNGVVYRTYAELIGSPKVNDRVRKAVAETNSQLASFESIKHFALLEHEFTVEDGELTPSLKVKRRVVESKYKELIESLYGAGETTVGARL